MVGIMGILIIGAIAYWLLRMGGLDTIKNTIGMGKEVSSPSVSTSGGGGNTNVNNASNVNRNINTTSGTHNTSQQTTSINGVVTRNYSSNRGRLRSEILPRI